MADQGQTFDRELSLSKRFTIIARENQNHPHR